VPAEGGEAISAEQWSHLGDDEKPPIDPESMPVPAPDPIEAEAEDQPVDENEVIEAQLEPEVEPAEEAALHVEEP
jgi:hypothetical protein